MDRSREGKLDPHVGQQVRRARAECGATLEEVARASSVAASTLERIEAGVERANAATLLRIADALGLSPHVFFRVAPAESQQASGRRARPDTGQASDAEPDRELSDEELCERLAALLDVVKRRRDG